MQPVLVPGVHKQVDKAMVKFRKKFEEKVREKSSRNSDSLGPRPDGPAEF